MRRAVFLDRDGTLNREIGYIRDPDDLILLAGVGPALVRLANAGYALVVISNQSAIGRGLIKAEVIDEVNARLRAFLAAEDVVLDGLFMCPHAPDEGCDCRTAGFGAPSRGAAWLLGIAALWLRRRSRRS